MKTAAVILMITAYIHPVQNGTHFIVFNAVVVVESCHAVPDMVAPCKLQKAAQLLWILTSAATKCTAQTTLQSHVRPMNLNKSDNPHRQPFRPMNLNKSEASMSCGVFSPTIDDFFYLNEVGRVLFQISCDKYLQTQFVL